MARKKKATTPKRHTATPAPSSKRPSTGRKSALPVSAETAVSEATDSNAPLSAVTVDQTTDALAAPVAEQSPASSPAEHNMPNTQTSALVNSLRDPSAEVAGEAAAALGASGDQSAVGPLMDVLVNADGYFHPVVRAAAATSLGQLRSKQAIPALIAGIRDEMAEASAESVRALAAIGDPRGVEPIIAVVRNDDDYFLSFVRRAAVLALIKLGGPEATATLKLVAEDYDEDPIIRQIAIDAMA